jgi:MFS family permease
MFIVGGALGPVWRENRYPERVHYSRRGYLLLALGESLWPIILGACLTGVGGALFSPSIEALLAKAGTHSEAKGKRSRAEWFALFAVCGELGAVLGPVAGALLTGLAFARWRWRALASFSLRWWCSTLPARVTPRRADAEARSLVDDVPPAALCRLYHCLQLVAVKL